MHGLALPEDTMSKNPVAPLSRRRLFAGAGTAGALATAAAVLPLQREAQPVAAEPKPAPEAGGGYQLTAHVKQYYQTTKV